MTEPLSPAELAEIERKVAAFREVVTRAALRRHAPKPKPAALAAKREARAALDQPVTQIAIIERLLAGERYNDLAAQHLHSPSWLSYHIRHVVMDQMHHVVQDEDCEWHRCMMAPDAEYRAVWLPLALARLRAKLANP